MPWCVARPVCGTPARAPSPATLRWKVWVASFPCGLLSPTVYRPLSERLATGIRSWVRPSLVEVTLLLGRGRPSFSQVTSGMGAAWGTKET